MLESKCNTIREQKDVNNRKEKLKLSLLMQDMSAYMENPKEFANN